MEKLKKAIIIIIYTLIITLFLILTYNEFFVKLNNGTNLKEELYDFVDDGLLTANTKEKVLEALEKIYGDENSKIEFLEENETSWTFFKKTLKDDQMISMYIVDKTSKEVILGTVVTTTTIAK